MGKIVINTVYNVYMYEHAVIHVPCRKATYIHLFYSILPLLEYVGCFFTCITILAVLDGHMELYTDGMQQSHLTCGPSVCCGDRGNTPLLYP